MEEIKYLGHVFSKEGLKPDQSKIEAVKKMPTPECKKRCGAISGNGHVPSKVQIKSNQITSLLLSHHHSTCALVSEILESVLQTVQNQFTYRQYVLTDLYR